MRTVAINDPERLSCSFTRLRCATPAKLIWVQFKVKTLGDLRRVVSDGGPNPHTTRKGGFDAAFAKLLWSLVIFFNRKNLIGPILMNNSVPSSFLFFTL